MREEKKPTKQNQNRKSHLSDSNMTFLLIDTHFLLKGKNKCRLLQKPWFLFRENNTTKKCLFRWKASSRISIMSNFWETKLLNNLWFLDLYIIFIAAQEYTIRNLKKIPFPVSVDLLLGYFFLPWLNLGDFRVVKLP